MPPHPAHPNPATLHLPLHGESAAADARHAARAFLDPPAGGGHPFPAPVLDAALLVVSELVTNAVRHAGGRCTLDMRLRSDGIDIEVTDGSREEPLARRPDQQGEGGWGWHLVNRISTDVEIRHHHGPPAGKTIHVHVARGSLGG
ncbi:MULTISPECIES: ATP-binding protein [Streptomyces]|uniref:ATP-binding protein n=1 Tax=Streptomyces TaxID=1883 RepID=UPI000F6E29C8|nr:ATP-binding protein [Streptomyces sp. W1SF4]AZM87446.1 ATP-binding protein [Streptomyces sp. W1SF4]